MSENFSEGVRVQIHKGSESRKALVRKCSSVYSGKMLYQNCNKTQKVCLYRVFSSANDIGIFDPSVYHIVWHFLLSEEKVVDLQDIALW